MFCKKCGKEARDDSKFCWNCGSDIEIKEEKNGSTIEIEKIPPGKTNCYNCKEEINEKLDTCPKCGVHIRIIVPKNPGIAAVLSFFVPGLGYVYDGKVVIGVMVTIIELALIGLSALLMSSSRIMYGLGLLVVGIIFWIYCICNSYDVAERINNNQYK